MECIEKDSLYHIFSQVIRLHYYRTHKLLEKVGVYPGQPPMLMALHIKDGQSQKELSDKLNIKPATITMMLKRMEKFDLVERKVDAEDQRVVRVYLTEQGKNLSKEVIQIMKIINQECFSNFTEEEKVLLRRLLMQMKDNLEEVCDKKLDMQSQEN
ncbi:MarR family winged helix-turn-helix transcriptional regulator [uncultured Clostridium sp.]|uniref:MarR family winged helix-turn-helix transcriptional regulator n=1 Tax=uncultured Clostridium sp. TaxID=59620 RepID=UPI0028E38E6E|nr:MarR family winged helix-turn-helix transcriptional regulator [uncultured Clostridium sp.]